MGTQLFTFNDDLLFRPKDHGLNVGDEVEIILVAGGNYGDGEYGTTYDSTDSIFGNYLTAKAKCGAKGGGTCSGSSAPYTGAGGGGGYVPGAVIQGGTGKRSYYAGSTPIAPYMGESHGGACSYQGTSDTSSRGMLSGGFGDCNGGGSYTSNSSYCSWGGRGYGAGGGATTNEKSAGNAGEIVYGSHIITQYDYDNGIPITIGRGGFRTAIYNSSYTSEDYYGMKNIVLWDPYNIINEDSYIEVYKDWCTVLNESDVIKYKGAWFGYPNLKYGIKQRAMLTDGTWLFSLTPDYIRNIYNTSDIYCRLWDCNALYKVKECIFHGQDYWQSLYWCNGYYCAVELIHPGATEYHIYWTKQAIARTGNYLNGTEGSDYGTITVPLSETSTWHWAPAVFSKSQAQFFTAKRTRYKISSWDPSKSISAGTAQSLNQDMCEGIGTTYNVFMWPGDYNDDPIVYCAYDTNLPYAQLYSNYWDQNYKKYRRIDTNGTFNSTSTYYNAPERRGFGGLHGSDRSISLKTNSSSNTEYNILNYLDIGWGTATDSNHVDSSRLTKTHIRYSSGTTYSCREVYASCGWGNLTDQYNRTPEYHVTPLCFGTKGKVYYKRPYSKRSSISYYTDASYYVDYHTQLNNSTFTTYWFPSGYDYNISIDNLPLGLNHYIAGGYKPVARSTGGAHGCCQVFW